MTRAYSFLPHLKNTLATITNAFFILYHSARFLNEQCFQIYVDDVFGVMTMCFFEAVFCFHSLFLEIHPFFSITLAWPLCFRSFPLVTLFEATMTPNTQIMIDFFYRMVQLIV